MVGWCDFTLLTYHPGSEKWFISSAFLFVCLSRVKLMAPSESAGVSYNHYSFDDSWECRKIKEKRFGLSSDLMWGD